MSLELSILFVDIPCSEGLYAPIEARTDALRPLVAAHSVWSVLVESGSAAREVSPRYVVRVHATAGGGQPIVSQSEHAECHAAIRDAFNITEWQLNEIASLAEERRARTCNTWMAIPGPGGLMPRSANVSS